MGRRRRLIAAAVLAAVLLAVGGWVGLRLLRQPWMVTRDGPSSPMASPAEPLLPFELPEELAYEFGWNGVSAATLLTAVSRRTGDGPDRIVFEYRAATLPILDGIWPFKAEGFTEMDPVSLRPLHAEMSKEGKKKSQETATTFDWDAGVATYKVRKTKDGKTTRKVKTAVAAPDIPAGLLAVRAADVPAGETRSMRVLSGDTLYTVLVSRGETASVEVPAGTFDAVAYDLSIREFDSDESQAEGEGKQKYRAVRVWVEPERRLPVKVEAQIVLGSIYAVLVRSGPAGPEEAVPEAPSAGAG